MAMAILSRRSCLDFLYALACARAGLSAVPGRGSCGELHSSAAAFAMPIACRRAPLHPRASGRVRLSQKSRARKYITFRQLTHSKYTLSSFPYSFAPLPCSHTLYTQHVSERDLTQQVLLHRGKP